MTIALASQSILRAARRSLPRTQFQLSSAYARLLSTLAVLEQRDGKINGSSLSAIAAAQKLGGPVTAFVAGSGVKGTAAAEVAKVKGLEKVIAIENDAYEKGLPENFAPLLVENIKKEGFTHVIGCHSAFGKNLLPRVAALLDVQPISDITAIESEDTFVRPIYAGNAILTVQSMDPIKAQGSSGAQGNTYTATAEPAAPSTAAPGDASLTNFTPGENGLEPSNFDDVSGFTNEDSAGDALAAFTEEQQSGLDLEGFQDSEFGDAFGASERRNDDDGDNIL
ncbi:Electron transfer flavoprotein alpha-subunit [Ascosphaera pollenicola]|nr:Electron transfer flavoprotein alpha-subunit [Ascosphaera pollenicola]